MSWKLLSLLDVCQVYGNSENISLECQLDLFHLLSSAVTKIPIFFFIMTMLR